MKMGRKNLCSPYLTGVYPYLALYRISIVVTLRQWIYGSDHHRTTSDRKTYSNYISYNWHNQRSVVLVISSTTK
jgi:hypothetical protein